MQTPPGYFHINELVLNFKVQQWCCGYINGSYFLDIYTELLMDERLGCPGSSLK